jgi:malate synthase
MGEFIAVGGLKIDPVLYAFVVDEVLPGTGIDPEQFWTSFAALVHTKSAGNRALLARRSTLQEQLDAWHREHRDQPHDAEAYREFLIQIGQLLPEAEVGTISTEGVDEEIAHLSGPQLIVPASNARYALNAANARWGSLYDALYGTDALGDPPEAGPYDPARGRRVIEWVRRFLDEVAPLDGSSHAEAVSYTVSDDMLQVELVDGSTCQLRDPALFAGFRGHATAPSTILLRQHGLHVELVIDPESTIGASDQAGVADVIIEAAVTAIVDFEDSVAAVDAADKVEIYRNWLGLMRGDLTETFIKEGRSITRVLEGDRAFLDPEGTRFVLPGRAVLMVRTVGLLMTTDAVIDRHGDEVPESFLDTMIAVLAALHDLEKPPQDRNSNQGSIYLVKPKLHGPDEVAFACEVIDEVEAALGLPGGTVKIGLMDEERRTSLNLAQCIDAAASRIAFINTGFLDRTGDEIRSSMEAGAMLRKPEMKNQPWLRCYEDRNVLIGMARGLPGRAQIGKGMWAAPDQMAKMLEEKIGHPLAGASCAWVPSPTAATLHATHYHQVDVRARQEHLRGGDRRINEMLRIPLGRKDALSEAETTEELENNVQGILGYVVRWIDQGVGCSKVPDIHGVALMEDRATCRISSQHIANWLHHGLVDRAEVLSAFERMACKVDEQNQGDPAYRAMAPDFDGVAFQAACDLVFLGIDQPSGYTEPILHARRRQQKIALEAS